MSTDRVVQITGKPNTCSDCVREVLDLLKTVSFLKYFNFSMYKFLILFFRHLLKEQKIHTIPIILTNTILMNMVDMVIQLVVVVV